MKPRIRQIIRIGRIGSFFPSPMLLGLAVLLGATSVAHGQLTTDLADLRGKDSFTDADRGKITAAVNAILQNMAEAESQADRVKLTREFRNVWGASSSLNFKDELATIMSSRLQNRMQNDPGEAVMLVLQSLRGWKHDRTIRAMRAGLEHASAAVRLIAAQGIQDLWAALPNGEVQPSIQALQEAGGKENDWIVCRQICNALAAAGNSPNIITAMLTIFEARLKAFDKHAEPGAETAVINYLHAQLANITPETRVRIARDLALLIAQAVPKYIKDVQDAEKNENPQDKLVRSQVSIDAAERLLADLVKERVQRVPNIRQYLKQGLPDGLEGMQIELNNWIGTPNQKGVLSDAPFNVPIGGGVTK